MNSNELLAILDKLDQIIPRIEFCKENTDILEEPGHNGLKFAYDDEMELALEHLHKLFDYISTKHEEAKSISKSDSQDADN